MDITLTRSTLYPDRLVCVCQSLPYEIYYWPHDPMSGNLWFDRITLPQVEAAIASGDAFHLHGDPGGPLPLPPGIQRCGVCGDPVRSPRCDCSEWRRSEVAYLRRFNARGFARTPQNEVGEAPEGGPQTVELLGN